MTDQHNGLYKLQPVEYARLRPLFEALDYHLATRSILAGDTPARVFADDPDRPRVAFVWAGHRFYLAGSPANADFNAAVGRVFCGEVYPHELAAGSLMYTLYFDHAGWEEAIRVILQGKYPIKDERRYYEFAAGAPLHTQRDWRAALPQGFSLHLVDRALLDQTRLGHLEDLKAEMMSERPAVQEFLQRSFGVCLVHDGSLAGWCLSEYNQGPRCEVGIETLDPYKRRGLGTLMTQALLELALSRDVTRVGWHCWASNTSSAATALKAGLRKVCDYPCYFAWYDEVDNLVVNGNVHFCGARYAEAMTWYERAFARGEAKGWGYWNAACAAAELGRLDDALRYLTYAVDLGSSTAERLRGDEHLRSLHARDEWEALLRRLQ